MKCEEARLLLHAWLDQELDPANSRAFEEHMGACPACADKVAGFSELSRAIKTEAPRHHAPAALRRRIANLAGGQPASVAPFKWGALGAAVSLAACLALFILVRPDEQYVMQEEIVASHIRSLQEQHLTDVVSTDQHTVKPWFNGRLDLSPPVVDMATDGFPLIGGRLDYIGDHPAAVLVYQYNKHIINLFIWHQTGTGLDILLPSAQQGYNLRRWRAKDMQFWAVSDVNAAKLAEFEQLYSSRTQ